MRAPLSIIIPTLNAASDLPETLAALVPGLHLGLIREVIISDGGSDDATLHLADGAGAIVVSGPPGRGQQLARGVSAAGGDWLLLLHADTQLSPEWATEAQAHISRGADRAGYFNLAFRTAGWRPGWVAGWANLRSRAFHLPFGDQGLLISKGLLNELGGVPELPLMEDVALARALKGRLRPLNAQAVTSSDRYIAEGWLRRGTRNLGLQLRFLLGADPEVLARAYRSRSEN